ncbi:MAG: SRPBCC family protein [Chloroflexi bacterium]|nr:SRPBCC family protein [Chloroflexota bacterium]
MGTISALERPMLRTTVSLRLPASISDVWRTYADFGEVQDWSPLVARSYLTSQGVEGVGMSRHCDLLPRGAVEETIVVWEPDTRMVVRVEPAGPIASQEITMTFEGGAKETTVRMTADIELRSEAADRAAQISDTFQTILRSTLAGLRHYLVTGESVDEGTALSEEGLGD